MKSCAVLATLSIPLSILFTSPLAHAQESAAANAASTDTSTAAAVTAAERWLARADANDGDATWDLAAPVFQAAIAKADWSRALQKARQPFGAVKARTLVKATPTRSLPGAADGDYVVITYDTAFEAKAHAQETIVPMRAPDGTWKVSGYVVR